MHRREFIASAAALAGAPVFGQSPAPAQPQPADAPARTLRTAVMYGMVADPAATTTLDKFNLLRDCGFDGVEMDSPSTIPTGEIAAAAGKSGLVVHGLVDSAHWRLPLNAPSAHARGLALDALRTCINDAGTLGCTSILLVPCVVNAQLPYDEAWRLSQEEIRKVLPLAREHAVTIGIENVWNSFITSPLEACRYVDELNAGGDPLVAWHFDVGNVLNFGWADQWVRILGKRLCKLHIKDFSRSKRDSEGLWKGFNVELGEGDAAWPLVMRALDDIGYATAPGGNWATAEVRGGDRTRLMAVRDQMRRILSA